MRKLLFIAALLAALAPLAAEVRGQGRGPAGPGDEVQPLSSILQRLRGRSDGRLLDANLDRGQGGRAVYVIRMLERDGRVRTLTVDAKSGEVLSDRGR